MDDQFGASDGREDVARVEPDGRRRPVGGGPEVDMCIHVLLLHVLLQAQAVNRRRKSTGK